MITFEIARLSSGISSSSGSESISTGDSLGTNTNMKQTTKAKKHNADESNNGRNRFDGKKSVKRPPTVRPTINVAITYPPNSSAFSRSFLYIMNMYPFAMAAAEPNKPFANVIAIKDQ
mmetsp:Transcript_236/g.588  ORF Transcript_236/g.588 Transcript_236/m.588 type:complete len:118 (-) Transcript_236:556-909(-)